jgi:hypothetical protein
MFQKQSPVMPSQGSVVFVSHPRSHNRRGLFHSAVVGKQRRTDYSNANI